MMIIPAVNVLEADHRQIGETIQYQVETLVTDIVFGPVDGILFGRWERPLRVARTLTIGKLFTLEQSVVVGATLPPIQPLFAHNS